MTAAGQAHIQSFSQLFFSSSTSIHINLASGFPCFSLIFMPTFRILLRSDQE